MGNKDVNVEAEYRLAPNPIVDATALNLTAPAIINVDTPTPIEAEVLPATATDKTIINWSVDDPSKARIENGIITGLSAGVVNVSATFADGATIAPYAKTAVEWAVAKKLMVGTNGNLLDPQASTTRAQMATILERYVQAFVK